MLSADSAAILARVTFPEPAWRGPRRRRAGRRGWHRPGRHAKLFWSLTLYEAENASGLATEARRFPSLGSPDKPVQNANGTTDLYIGPKAPEGKETNWLPTAPGRGFFAILRLYGFGETAIDYSWKPGDIQKAE